MDTSRYQAIQPFRNPDSRQASRYLPDIFSFLRHCNDVYQLNNGRKRLSYYLDPYPADPVCQWHPYTPPNTVPAQQSSGQGKLSSVIPWASTHTRAHSSHTLTHTLSLEELGPRPFLAPSRHRRFDVVGHLAHFLARISGHRHFPLPPSLRLPQPYLSSPPLPLPLPPKAAASHEPFYFLFPPVQALRSPRPLCVFRQRDLGWGDGGGELQKGDRGFPCCVNFWARTRPGRGT